MPLASDNVSTTLVASSEGNVNNACTTAVSDVVFQCECGMRFLRNTFLFYHRRDQCELWRG